MKHRISIHIAIIVLALNTVLSLKAEGQTAPALNDLSPATSNDPESLFQQARALLRGDGVKKDTAQAFKLMQAAADLGHADAMGGLGYFYSQGVSVAKNLETALEWFRKGAVKGSAKSQYNLGTSLIKSNEANPDEMIIKEGVEWIRKAADQKLTEANLSFGIYAYLGERTVAQNYEIAASHFKIAADQGLAEAQNYLGTMHENGQGMSVDQNQAIAWYRKAALQGHLRAQANLGRTIGTNNTDEKMQTAALAWLTIAAQRGDVTAEKCLMDVESTVTPEMRQKINAEIVEIRKQIKPRPQSER